MKLIWIGAFVLLFASVASLVSNRQSGRLIEQNWARASNVLPDTELSGFLEGSWARANQRALVKMHSPMRFSLALASLGFMPVLALLWVAAPLAVSATLLVFALGTVGIISTRNLVVHAPTQF